jgi:Major Facilitator Superfamily
MNKPSPPHTGTPPEVRKRNFQNVQIDAIGVGLASAAAPFLPVLLARLHASNFAVGLLTTMPSVTGLVLALAAGRFLQTRRNVVPWFSLARLIVLSCYALTGLIPWIVPPQLVVPAILAVWAAATLPQVMVAVGFSVVMNAVAGPEGRYSLMSRRWFTLGLTGVLTTAALDEVLKRWTHFPLNYQFIFLGLSLGGLISYYFSSHIRLPDTTPPAQIVEAGKQSIRQGAGMYLGLLRGQPAFVSFVSKRMVYLLGVAFAAPLFPLYFVNVIDASDDWIAKINMAFTIGAMIGYVVWTRLSRKRGSRLVLLATTLGMSLYPVFVASTGRVEIIRIFALMAGVFQAGLDLVFFDELMKTVPEEYSATFVALAQSMGYVSTIFGPMLATLTGNWIGVAGALVVSGVIRLTGFALFAWKGRALRNTISAETGV